MATSNPLRLNLELVQAAGVVAKRSKRTVPHQIEYWAELGRAVEQVVDPATLISIQEGFSKLVVEVAPSKPVSSSKVFAAVANLREKGGKPYGVDEAPLKYQSSQDKPGFLEEIHPDGSRIIGRFYSGQFHPLKDEDK